MLNNPLRTARSSDAVGPRDGASHSRAHHDRPRVGRRSRSSIRPRSHWGQFATRGSADPRTALGNLRRRHLSRRRGHAGRYQSDPAGAPCRRANRRSIRATPDARAPPDRDRTAIARSLGSTRRLGDGRNRGARQHLCDRTPRLAVAGCETRVSDERVEPRANQATALSFATSSSSEYSSEVSAQSSNWMTPTSVKRSRSQPPDASRSPSFLQFGTIFENNICWNIC